MIYKNYHKEYTEQEIETLMSIVEEYGYCKEAFVAASERLSRPKDLLRAVYRRRCFGKKLRRGERITVSGQIKSPYRLVN